MRCGACGHCEDDVEPLPADCITTRRARVAEAGGCNFCGRPCEYVTVLRGNRRTLEARMCDRCLGEMKRATR